MPSPSNYDGGTVYLDYNATTPMAAEVVADITEALTEHWANPSSSYARAVAAKDRLEAARREVAASIGAHPENIIFTSGGTEGNNAVVAGCVDLYQAGPGVGGTPHVVTTDVEHDSVALPLRRLEKRGLVTVTWLSAAEGGGVSPESVLAAVTPDTCLVTIIMANNETGVVNDIAAIGLGLSRLPARDRLWFHTDSAQVLGKLPLDVAQLHVDFCTVVGHKFYGPRIGALYCSRRALSCRHVRGGWPCVSLLSGGGQERGLRAGTENVPMAVGLAAACRLVRTRGDRDAQRMAQLRDQLERQLLSCGVAERINCAASRRLPNTSSVVLACGQQTGRDVLARAPALMASTSAACHSQQRDAPSGVLVRSGVSVEAARRTVRLSVGRDTSERDISAAVRLLRRAVRAQPPADADAEECAPTAAKLQRTHSTGCLGNGNDSGCLGNGNVCGCLGNENGCECSGNENGNECLDHENGISRICQKGNATETREPHANGNETRENQQKSTSTAENRENATELLENQESTTGSGSA